MLSQLSLDDTLEMQRQFAAHIRSPETVPAPHDIAEERMQVYRTLFFSNVTVFLDDTFEVLSKLVGQQWRFLNRQFFEQYQAQSPYFHRISNEFLNYVESHDVLHPAQVELARYEQRLFDAEVLVYEEQQCLKDLQCLKNFQKTPEIVEIWLETVLQLRSSVCLEGFEYDVLSMLSASRWNVIFEDKVLTPQFFAFYRDMNNRVQTVMLSPMTMMLLEQFKQPTTPLTVFQFLAASSGMSFECIAQFGLEYIQSVYGQMLLS